MRKFNSLPSVKELKKLAEKKIVLKDLFEADSKRFEKLHLQFKGLLLDYSKNHVDAQILSELLNLATESELKNGIEEMFKGEHINHTENRAVLHSVLRMPAHSNFNYKGESISADVDREKDKVELFSNRLRSGEWVGFTGERITDVVNIGIGGSDLGPKMVCEALKFYSSTETKVHFVSNVDASDLMECIKVLNPETTLFIIASKTFTTQETMTNAESAKEWFNIFAGPEHVKKHFVAVSSNKEAVTAFGIDPVNMFGFWDWVGGRYSLWSSIGLSIACSVGYEKFLELLSGAHAMDEHFRNTDFSKNIPVLLALIGIWYNNFLGAQSHAVLPYDNYLKHLPAYLQQADMESNGKSNAITGEEVDYQTGPIVWGEAGTNGQHAFFQLLHQGTKLISTDFIVAKQPLYELSDHHKKLFANCIAQTEALMNGLSEKEVEKQMKVAKMDPISIKVLKPFKSFEGNRPSNTIVLDKINPYNLGALIAMYEHKIFVQGFIWNLNSFDQMGVELGKVLAGNILRDLDSNSTGNHDSSTQGLLNHYFNSIKDNK